MAGILHANSIIADSTASSSPPRPAHHDEDVPDSNVSAPIEPRINASRVARTYGRPKPDAAIADSPEDDLRSRARILRTAPRHADDQVIPESDDADGRAPSFEGFAWRARLQEIDEEDGGSEERNTTNASMGRLYEASATRSEGSRTLQPSPESPLSGPSHLHPLATIQSTDALVTERLFDGSLSTLLSSAKASSPPSSATKSNLASHDLPEQLTALYKQPHSYKRVVRSPVHTDTDNASPEHSYAINSPKQRSSSTPPTSPLIGELTLPDVSASGEDPIDDAAKLGRKGGQSKKAKRKSKGKERERPVKGPTKKEVLEMRKESARLLADQHVSISRSRAHSPHTIASLFNKLKNTQTTAKQDSDPITSFSSPRQVFGIPGDASLPSQSTPAKFASLRGRHTSKAEVTTARLSRAPSPQDGGINPPVDTERDVDMPGVDALLREHQGKRRQQIREQTERTAGEKRSKELNERKRKALEVSKLQASSRRTSSSKGAVDSETDDDLEIETMDDSRSHPHRAAAEKDIGSLVERRLITTKDRRTEKEVVGPHSHAHRVPASKDMRSQLERKRNAIEVKKGIASPESDIVSQKNLALAAMPSFMFDRGKKGSKRGEAENTSISHKDLNNLILQRAHTQSAAIEEKKMEKWVQTGRLLKGQSRGNAEEKSVTDWLLKGSTREDAMDIDEDEHESSEDPDYMPEDVEHNRDEDSEEETGDAGAPDDEDHVLGQRMDISEEEAEQTDTDKENLRPAPRRQSARAIVDSDDDDDIAVEARRRPIVPAAGTSFGEDNGQDSPGEDKENSATLAFDLGEDKENARVPRLLPRGRFPVGDELLLSSPSSPVFLTDEDRVNREPLSRLDTEGFGGGPFMPPPLAQGRDRVLQVLHEEDKDATLAPVTSGSKRVLRRSSSPPASDDAERSKFISPGAFSQLFTEHDGEEPAPGPVIDGSGLSQFFSQGRDGGDIFNESPSNGKARRLFAQRSVAAGGKDEFEFTQPSALLPSVRISESQRRAVDEMFGKDQEFKLDQAKRSRDEERAETTSDLSSLNFGPFVPSQPTQLSPQSIRRPLETLSLESGGNQFDASPGEQPFRRSRLLRERPSKYQPREASSSPSPPLRNAFDVLRDGPIKSKARDSLPKRKLEKSEFVEAEAQESDEEAMLGFGGVREENDEEGGDEDENAIVEGLVDDAAMDEKAQAAALVLEKHMEHQAADDAALEKLHQDVVDGKLRGKRRDRGVGFEDSDSDDDGFRGPRKPLYKKRKVDGDTLDAYGENPETRPFYDAYQADLAEEDDPTLAYLRQEEVVPMQGDQDNESGEDEPGEEVDVAEVRRQIREISKRERSVSPELDLNSVGWIDSEDQEMDDDMQIKVQTWQANKKNAKASQSTNTLEHLGYQGSFKGKGTGAGEQMQLKTWASQEAKIHSSANGRGGFSRKEEGGNRSRKRDRASIMSKGSAAGGSSGDTGPARSSSLISQLAKSRGFDA